MAWTEPISLKPITAMPPVGSSVFCVPFPFPRGKTYNHMLSIMPPKYRLWMPSNNLGLLLDVSRLSEENAQIKIGMPSGANIIRTIRLSKNMPWWLEYSGLVVLQIPDSTELVPLNRYIPGNLYYAR